MSDWTAQEIAQRVGGKLEGPADLRLRGVQSLEEAGPDQLTFIRDAKFVRRWDQSRAGAALVDRRVALDVPPGRALIRVANADLAMAAVLELFAPPKPCPPAGIHSSAVVDPSAQVGPGSAIGPGCVIGAGVHLGAGCILHASVTILQDSVLGEGCELWPGVVIRERCELGDRVILHPNVVIGADGFGYRPSPDGRGIVKVPQIGTVRIGSDVEIGAGTCVDRGKFGPTVIGDQTKIDNLCQIAHNVQIGRCVIIAGQTAIGGSARLGDGVVMGGGAAVKDQVTIGPGVQVAAIAGVMADVPAGQKVAGYFAQEAKAALREIAALRRLPDLLKRLRKLEGTEPSAEHDQP